MAVTRITTAEARRLGFTVVRDGGRWYADHEDTPFLDRRWGFGTRREALEWIANRRDMGLLEEVAS